uniref:Solute carrier organic anion transporter family member n=1 Tax=Brugia malayi TaxID=6279 RepID=A0A1I9G248_BRUMA|nr:Bm4182, isoform b [Brugia malayi]
MHIFFAVFAIVLLVESISVTYIISTTQAIERQFQVPSKLSGFMVILHTFLWLSLCHILALKAIELNGLKRLLPSDELLLPNAELAKLFDYELINDRIFGSVREDFLKKVISLNDHSFHVMPRNARNLQNSNEISIANDNYTLNEPLLSKIIQKMHTMIDGNISSSDMSEVKNLLQKYVTERANETLNDLNKIQNSVQAPFAYCSKLINEMRQIIRTTTCGKKFLYKAPILMLFFGLIGFGVGRSMPWSLGVPLIDDSFSKKNLPAFFAGMNFIRILGPVCGFLIGSFCSSFYYTLKPPPGLSAKDPTWIGAWWLGYLLIGLLLIGPSTALYFFPVRTKSTIIDGSVKDNGCVDQKDIKISIFDKHRSNDIIESPSIFAKFRALHKAYAEILQSKIFVGLLVARSLDLLAFRGYMVFLPKYLETQFGIPQYNVYILMAFFGIFGLAIGAISGGVIVRRHKFSGRGAAILILVLSMVNIALFFSKAFFGCYSTVSTVGANGRLTNYNYTQPCNANCDCQSAPLYPICDKSGYAYFSPCHAGCHDVRMIDVRKQELEFSSCECKPEEVLSRKNCQDNCSLKAALFFILIIIGSFVVGNCLVPGMLLLLRSVPPVHRSIALGFQGFVVSLFASLPSPLIWGAVVDTTCLVWSYTCPEAKGACAIYEPVLLRQRLHFTYVAFRLASALADLYVIKHAGGINILGEEDERQKYPEDMEAPQIAGQSVRCTLC